MLVVGPMSFKHLMVEIRVQYLLLPIVLSLVGGMLAYNDGHFDLFDFLLFTAVLVLLHVTVNTLNDYYDDKYGIDRHQRMRSASTGGPGCCRPAWSPGRRC